MLWGWHPRLSPPRTHAPTRTTHTRTHTDTLKKKTTQEDALCLESWCLRWAPSRIQISDASVRERPRRMITKELLAHPYKAFETMICEQFARFAINVFDGLSRFHCKLSA